MHALAIVTLTLAVLAGLLFGSDYLDRRLLVRSGQPLPEPPSPGEASASLEAGRPAALLAGEPAAGLGGLAPAEASPLAPTGRPAPPPAGPLAPVAEPPAPAPVTTTDRSARPARVPAPLPACRHGRGRRRDRAPQVRHDAGHGPLAVTPGRWGTLATASGPESPRS
jgi:hypothetical protein